MASGSSSGGGQRPARPNPKDPAYPTSMLSYGVTAIDFSKLADPKSPEFNEARHGLADELAACRELAGTWSDSVKVAKECETLLAAASEKIAGADSADDLRAARENLHQVRGRLARAGYSSQSGRLVVGLLAYNLAVLALVLFLLVWLALWPAENINGNLVVLAAAANVGAIGGIFDALRALHMYYGDREFDRGRWLWYIVNPFIGGILGGVIFGAILAGLLSTTGSGFGATVAQAPQAEAVVTPSSSPTAIPGGEIAITPAAEPTSTPVAAVTPSETQGSSGEAPATNNKETPAPIGAIFILVVAFLAGFKQNSVIAFLERVAKAVFGG